MSDPSPTPDASATAPAPTEPTASAPIEIRGAVDLPARREDVTLSTDDGLTLVGELALPESAAPAGTLLFLHPLPTAGGFMDSHIVRKSSGRLPALADLAVLRFNFRGVTSPRGTSEGVFGEGVDERHDLEAALRLVAERGLPKPWLVGWSFGTEVLLKHGRDADIAGAILLSPPLHRTSDAELARWRDFPHPLVALVPEHDDFLKPAEATERFAIVPNLELVAVEEAKHLWVGEKQTYRVLSEIVQRVNPAALPLPTQWPAG
ncbi:alpha/beta hydrolase [Schumannella sp. 10F1B-5-1]|uniref:alpha/beta hydrolase n=1 Tax=Schumannella sp. 10F1B-5-1 TaxID=2590780 RepID=UPI0011327E65|nr:alpha/beta fold hydrolase [Schumannella sp. 10F1B-5-1]TPW72371.1 alpha/beta hydrolase [Schumannella sp. 10F1B-5-1]